MAKQLLLHFIWMCVSFFFQQKKRVCSAHTAYFIETFERVFDHNLVFTLDCQSYVKWL